MRPNISSRTEGTKRLHNQQGARPSILTRDTWNNKRFSRERLGTGKVRRLIRRFADLNTMPIPSRLFPNFYTLLKCSCMSLITNTIEEEESINAIPLGTNPNIHSKGREHKEGKQEIGESKKVFLILFPRISHLFTNDLSLTRMGWSMNSIQAGIPD